MVFHADYEEALEQYDSPNSTLRVGDLVRPAVAGGWAAARIGIVLDVYDVVHDMTGESYLCCKVFMTGKIRTYAAQSLKLVERE